MEARKKGLDNRSKIEKKSTPNVNVGQGGKQDRAYSVCGRCKEILFFALSSINETITDGCDHGNESEISHSTQGGDCHQMQMI